MMREMGLAIATTLVLIMIGTHAWGGPIPRLWAHALAHDCEAGAPAQRCVLTTDAQVLTRWDDTGRTVPEATLTLTTPERGELVAFLTTSDTDRLGIVEDETVRVTALDGAVLTVTGPTGETAATSNLDLSEAALRFLVVSAASILAVTLAGLGWRRRKGGALWVRPAAASTTAGVFVGLGATNLVGRDLAMPVLFGGTAVASLLLAYVWVVHLRPALTKD